jgi:hypothetical protein
MNVVRGDERIGRKQDGDEAALVWARMGDSRDHDGASLETVPLHRR